jgi:F0F1-type ATP synthase gamma subunit
MRAGTGKGVAGFVVVATDKGLCGGLNTNIAARA